MGRFTFRGSAVLMSVLLGCSFLSSCSGGASPTQITNNEIPAIVTLTPGPNASVEVGQTLAFTASAENSQGSPITETFTYQSSAPGTVTVSDSGLACAGSWDSLSAPTVCTPGALGVAQVTAVANGVPSPPVTVYVHQHVTSVVIQQVPGQAPTLSTTCFSRAAATGPESTLYEAFAFNGSTDLTSSVGPFTWQSSAAAVSTSAAVSLFGPGVTAPLNQEIAQAGAPGSTSIFASAGGVNSQPLPFTTCPVQTISISAQNFPATQKSFFVGSGTTMTLNATVIDSIGRSLTGVPLTWNTSNSGSVTAAGVTTTVYGSTGTVSFLSGGSGAVTASCTPPSCNGGITPSMPIYPAQAITFTVASNSTANSSNPTVYVTSTGCRTTTTTCITQIVPVTRSSSTSPFTAGTPVPLPFAPNSALFDQSGANEYLGVDGTAFGTKGAMVVSGGSTATPISSVAGQVLAISPDGLTTLFSDTVDSPQQILICSGCSGSGRTLTHLLLCDPASTTCSTTPAAAAFSPDSLKAYIVSSNPCPGTTSAGCLLIYSKLDAPQYIQLAAPATSAAFIGSGVLGYLAGGDPAGATLLSTCAHPNSSGLPPGSGVAATVQFLLPLQDGQSVLAFSPPNFETISATVSGTSSVGASGCPAPRGFLNITNTVTSAGNLGTGSFTPSQFFLAPDGTTAYILGSPSLSVIVQYDLKTRVPLQISLAGNATPLSASLSPLGDLLFVGANDGALHVIDTSSLADIQQVTFPFSQNESICVGPGTPATQAPVTCNPDLVAAKP